MLIDKQILRPHGQLTHHILHVQSTKCDHTSVIIGNDNINALTSQESYDLRFDIEDFDGHKTYAIYHYFSIEDGSTGYRITVDYYDTISTASEYQTHTLVLIYMLLFLCLCHASIGTLCH